MHVQFAQHHTLYLQIKTGFHFVVDKSYLVAKKDKSDTLKICHSFLFYLLKQTQYHQKSFLFSSKYLEERQ